MSDSGASPGVGACCGKRRRGPACSPPLQVAADVTGDAVALHVPPQLERVTLRARQKVADGLDDATRPLRIDAHFLDVHASIFDNEEAATRHELREAPQ